MTRLQEEIIARSESMQRVLDLARRAAASEATVLITGECGTGKERLARHVHELSARSDGPFVPINCGALPENLLESELFGHAKGAFTGASGERKGLFEAASGGTLFLDEIGDTSPTMQVRLLRALQERRVRPVGANKEVSVDARVVAATNRDLSHMVSEGSFRKDLFYRLRVVPLQLPSLRDRRDDILPLSRHFIARTCATNRCGPCSLSADVLDVLHRYSWPGNVRELENAIERAVVLAEGQPDIRLSDLPPEVRGEVAPPIATTTTPPPLDDRARSKRAPLPERLPVPSRTACVARGPRGKYRSGMRHADHEKRSRVNAENTPLVGGLDGRPHALPRRHGKRHDAAPRHRRRTR